MKRAFACLTALLLLLSALSFTGCGGKEKYVAVYYEYFDTATQIIGYADSKEEFNAVCGEIRALLETYHRAYDIYHSYAGVTNLRDINRRVNGEGVPVEVGDEILGLLTFAKEMYALTGGKTNVAMGSVLSVWHEYREAGIDEPWAAEIPPEERLAEAAEHTDILDLVLDKEAKTVLLADPIMTLDVGAVAKGYAVERIAEYLESRGLEGYLLNVGGNVRAIGSRPGGIGWATGLENPDRTSEEAYIEYLSLTDVSIVTSGVYQRYYYVDNVRYHHIIDPDTLYPGNRYLSVSVITKDSGMGDAFSTALFNMDFEEGLALVESTKDVEAIWVYPDGTKRYSSGFADYRS